MLDCIDQEMPRSVAEGDICNRPLDQLACESVDRLRGLTWKDVTLDSWRRSSVLDALTDEAFVYYLPSLMKHSFERLPEVELSFDSLLFDLKTNFTREATGRKNQRFSISEDESRDMLNYSKSRFCGLGELGLEALLEMLKNIALRWPDDVDKQNLSESLSRVRMLLEECNNHTSPDK